VGIKQNITVCCKEYKNQQLIKSNECSFFKVYYRFKLQDKNWFNKTKTFEKNGDSLSLSIRDSRLGGNDMPARE